MAGTETDKIFVVGNSRSGTTMLARILGKNSKVYTFNELHFLEQTISTEDFLSANELEKDKAIGITSRLLGVIRNGYFAHTNSSELAIEATEIIRKLEVINCQTIFSSVTLSVAAENEKSVICEQTPRNVFYIDELLKAYPSARIVNIVRDPRDVLLSQKNKWKRRFLGAKNIPLYEAIRSWSNYHPLVIAKIWKAAVNAIIPFQNNPNVLTVQYEQVTGAPEQTTREICKHCRIIFEYEMLDVNKEGSSGRKDNEAKAGIDRSRVGSWQTGGLSKAEVYICENMLTIEMDRFGYINSGYQASIITLLFWYSILPFKLSISLLLNIRRVKSLKSWVGKRMGY